MDFTSTPSPIALPLGTRHRSPVTRALLCSATLLLASLGGCDEPDDGHADARADLVMSLTGIEFGCSTDPSGELATDALHPEVADRYRGAICGVSEQTVNAFGDAKRSSVRPLGDTALASKASDLGIKPTDCLLFVSGEAKVATCHTTTGAQIVHLEKPGKVQ